MPHQFINHLRDKEAVHQFFRVRRAEERTTKDRKPFLDLILGDRSGTIRARVWSDVLMRCPAPLPPEPTSAFRGR